MNSVICGLVVESGMDTRGKKGGNCPLREEIEIRNASPMAVSPRLKRAC